MGGANHEEEAVELTAADRLRITKVRALALRAVERGGGTVEPGRWRWALEPILGDNTVPMDATGLAPGQAALPNPEQPATTRSLNDWLALYGRQRPQSAAGSARAARRC